MKFKFCKNCLTMTPHKSVEVKVPIKGKMRPIRMDDECTMCGKIN